MDSFLEFVRIRKRNCGLIPNLLRKRNIFIGRYAVSSNGRLMRLLNMPFSYACVQMQVLSSIQKVKA